MACSPGLLYRVDDSTWDSENEFIGVPEKKIWVPNNVVVISSSLHGEQQVYSHGAYVYDSTHAEQKARGMSAGTGAVLVALARFGPVGLADRVLTYQRGDDGLRNRRSHGHGSRNPEAHLGPLEMSACKQTLQGYNVLFSRPGSWTVPCSSKDTLRQSSHALVLLHGGERACMPDSSWSTNLPSMLPTWTLLNTRPLH